MERWWRDYAMPTLSDNTRDCYAGIWERHVRNRLGGYRLRDVTPAVVAGLKADLTREGVGAATIHKALAIVSGMFRQAVIWDRVDRNPVREIKLPASDAKAVRASGRSADGRGDAGGAPGGGAAARRDARVGARVRGTSAGGGSGAAVGGRGRADDPGRARGGGLDGQGDENGGDSDGQAPGATRARSRAVARTERRATSGLVFPMSRGTLWTDFDWRNWRKRVYRPTAEGVGLTGSRPYDLRHSFASLLIHEGVSVLEVARQVGNSPGGDADDVRARVRGVRASRSRQRGRRDRGGASGVRCSRRVRGDAETRETAEGGDPASMLEADARTRTGDPFITSEVLYQLSYVGGERQV